VNDQSFILISTPRLTLRFPAADEAGALARFYERNRAHFSQFLNCDRSELSSAIYWQRSIPQLVADATEEHSYKLFAFRHERPHEPVGVVNLFNIVRDDCKSCSLGYRIDRYAQGHGYMTEAVRAAIEFAFAVLGIDKISANYAVANEPSGRLLKRLCFEREWVAHNYHFINGVWVDHVMTSRRSAARGDNETVEALAFRTETAEALELGDDASLEGRQRGPNGGR